MSSSSQSPFSLRPWPTGDKKAKTLTEFIARVNSTPDGFRNVTEESLRQEIEAEESGRGAEANDDMSVDSEGDESNEGDEGSATATIEDIRAARDELIRNSEIVHQNAMMALDSVSLLLSKEMPVQASTTMSPMLREYVGIGTLGAEKLAAPNTSTAGLQDHKLVQTGWKLDDISRTADSVLSSASRLQKEISLETKYWAEVLAVSERGWSVSRLPHERHTLGVTFGFSEAAPSFRNNSLAPMRRGKNGQVELDTGRVGGSQRLLVKIEKDGKVIGRSSMPKPTALADAPLEDRVLEARSTIFSQELWHEINREGRNLLSYNVRLDDSSVSYAVDDHLRVVFSLSTPGDEEADAEEKAWGSRPKDGLAETLSIAMHLLLSYAHQQNNHKRSQPASLSANPGRPNQAYYLLRPLIAHLKHQKSVERATRFMSQLTEMLHSAGITAAAYTLTEASIPTQPAEGAHRFTSSEAVITSMLGPLEFKFELTITAEARVAIRRRTAMGPAITTSWDIQLLPPASSEGSTAQNPLQASYPPIESYPNLREVIYYLRQAVARALVDRFEPLVIELTARNGTAAADSGRDSDRDSDSDPDSAPKHGGAGGEWTRTIGGNAYTDMQTETREVRFQVSTTGHEHDDDDGSGGGGGDEEALAEVEAGRYPPELRVFGAWFAAEGGKRVRRRWTWTVDAARAGVPKEPLEEVVLGIVEGKAKGG